LAPASNREKFAVKPENGAFGPGPPKMERSGLASRKSRVGRGILPFDLICNYWGCLVNTFAPAFSFTNIKILKNEKVKRRIRLLAVLIGRQ
jgi:hypothetical protein